MKAKKNTIVQSPLKVIVISRSLGELEKKLLRKNIERIRRVFGDASIAYVLGEGISYKNKPFHDPMAKFYHVSNPSAEHSAALSRRIGYDALCVSESDIVLFLDGDMLVKEKYLAFLRKIGEREFLSQCDRVDIRSARGNIETRTLHFDLRDDGRFAQLYGSIAMRGIAYQKYTLITHDMEEQWLLRLLEMHPAHHIKFEKVGILHFDRHVGVGRGVRLLRSSRGVGFWQGLLRDKSLTRIASDINFIFNQKKRSWVDISKLLATIAIGFPKVFIFRAPKEILYTVILCDPPDD